MIRIDDKTSCCGCEACSQVCPVSCIEMKEDFEGFLYPLVNEERCVRCGKCEDVCPVLHPREGHPPSAVYAIKHMGPQRRDSASGGAFSCFAEPVLKAGGVVFGARFNEAWSVEHGYAETVQDLEAFRGSKYVQSRIGNCYLQARHFLQAGRRVLFSGTPCQIAGLRTFLGETGGLDLLTVELICHGTPSPDVWRKYIMEFAEKKRIRQIHSIKFRDKIYGWRQFSFVMAYKLEHKNAPPITFYSEFRHDNLFMQGFFGHFYLRPICYSCPFRCFKSGADITIGDFWGIEDCLPDFEDPLGVSVVLVNNAKKFEGEYAESFNECVMVPVSYADAFRKNPCLEKSVTSSPRRHEFFSRYREEPLLPLLQEMTKKTLYRRLRRCVGNFLRRMGLRK